ncbi:hypothetical protein BJ912DRAFT_950534, partial [Pholiota molesta]
MPTPIRMPSSLLSNTTTSDFLAIPLELHVLILRNLDAVSLVRCAMTCVYMNEIVENSSQLIASPDEAIEFLHDAYRHKETCHKRQKSAVRKAHLARIEAEKTLREAEYYAEKIVGLIRKNGFQLESRDPGFFVLVDGCKHTIITAGSPSSDIIIVL